ncbi:MAG: 4-hydroxy-tetrahydrodipicolinate reductase [Clostridia bacterium]|nr:4-hydroxy-tetrahydrodipicolinate reductase [Clostridia bacterium]
MTSIILSGACGHMGRVIADTVRTKEGFEIVCGFDIKQDVASPFPVYSSPKEFSGRADVIIDFSHPSAFEGVLDYAVNTKTPVVFATTGLSEEQKNKMKAASEKTAVFYSANMSLGISVITALAKRAAEILGDNFDIEIIEKHHHRKLDAPSGTALAIADELNEKDDFEYVYDRHSVRKARSPKEIGIHSVRGGTIVGEHTVLFAGNDEVIEIKHSAASREIFATGAIAAAGFLKGKPAGMYSMKDIVEI